MESGVCKNWDGTWGKDLNPPADPPLGVELPPASFHSFLAFPEVGGLQGCQERRHSHSGWCCKTVRVEQPPLKKCDSMSNTAQHKQKWDFPSCLVSHSLHSWFFSSCLSSPTTNANRLGGEKTQGNLRQAGLNKDTIAPMMLLEQMSKNYNIWFSCSTRFVLQSDWIVVSFNKKNPLQNICDNALISYFKKI